MLATRAGHGTTHTLNQFAPCHRMYVAERPVYSRLSPLPTVLSVSSYVETHGFLDF
jgi:hypothetical protein